MYNIEMVWIPKFTHASISSVVFGGFYAGKYLASQPHATPDTDLPEVDASGTIGTVPALSTFGVPAWRNISYLNAKKAASNVNRLLNTKGYHLMTAFEWASIAMWCRKNKFLPSGNNGNANPPDDSITSESATLDRAAYDRLNTNYFNLTGTGPVSWNHNATSDGVADLNGNAAEWVMGLHMQTADESGHEGHALILATLDVTLDKAPYGYATVSGSTMTDTDKNWTVNAFTAGGDVGAVCYVMSENGTRYEIDSNTADTITLTSGTPNEGPYEIVIDTGTDMTDGCTTAQEILTVRDSDADLKAFGIPATTGATGAISFGRNGYYFDTTDSGIAPYNVRTALRGGTFTLGNISGVFCLDMTRTMNTAGHQYGFRIAKAI